MLRSSNAFSVCDWRQGVLSSTSGDGAERLKVGVQACWCCLSTDLYIMCAACWQFKCAIL